MELILRRRRTVHTDAGLDVDESEASLSGFSGAIAAVLATALAGGVSLSALDIGVMTTKLVESGKVDIAASAAAVSPVRKRYDINAMAARSTSIAAIYAAEQQSFQFAPLETGEDLLALVDEHGGAALVTYDQAGVIDSITASFTTEYDSDEAREVLESLQATGVTPKKLVGDLAQASIVTATGQEQVISLAEWTISWKRKMVEATDTDNALYESSLGSTKSWTVTAKFMFVDGDQSQVDAIVSAIDTTALDPIVWNFFPTVEQGRQAFQGAAFIESITVASGSGKIVGLDVSLKGTGPLKRLVQLAPTPTTTVSGVQGQV